MWINRFFYKNWQRTGTQAIRIVVGLRQSGKTSFLRHVAEQPRVFIDLDDLQTRELAQNDPKVFLDQFPSILTIDEAQYAPNLFPELKKRIDRWKLAKRNETPTNSDAPSYWLTESNRLLLDREVSESLTGRATYYQFHTLSLAEINFSLGKVSFGQFILKGGWPELWAEPDLDHVSYLNDHIQTALVKDLINTARIVKVNEFLKVLRLLSGRVGQLFNASEFARDSGVKSETVSDWISLLERMLYLIQVPAFHSSITTRLVKAPKYYFTDLGLAARLQGWTSPEPMLTSPYLGFIFENAVVAEILKTRDAIGKDWFIYHWRTKDNEEVDFVITSAQKTLAIECKYSSTEAGHWRAPKEIKKLRDCQFVVVSLSGGMSGQQYTHLALHELSSFLQENM